VATDGASDRRNGEPKSLDRAWLVAQTAKSADEGREDMTDECGCLGEIFSSFKGREDEIIPLLQSVQERFGYLPEKAMFDVARFTRVPESAVYAVATFYAQFRFTPIGRKHVTACRGTACHVRGAPRILEAIEKRLGIQEGETSPDLEYSLETVACIGACGLSPCIMVNKKVEAKMTPRKVAELFAEGNHDD
jgi:NADH-quinone oxidoreductase subunit E